MPQEYGLVATAVTMLIHPLHPQAYSPQERGGGEGGGGRERGKGGERGLREERVEWQL